MWMFLQALLTFRRPFESCYFSMHPRTMAQYQSESEHYPDALLMNSFLKNRIQRVLSSASDNLTSTRSDSSPSPAQLPPRSSHTSEVGQVSSSVRKIEARLTSTVSASSNPKGAAASNKSYVSQFSSKLGFGSSSSPPSVSTPTRPNQQSSSSESTPNPNPNLNPNPNSSSMTSKTSSLFKSAFSFYKTSPATTTLPNSTVSQSSASTTATEQGASGQGVLSPHMISIQISSPVHRNGNRLDADPAASPLAKMSEKLVGGSPSPPYYPLL